MIPQIQGEMRDNMTSGDGAEPAGKKNLLRLCNYGILKRFYKHI
jgi:hypothetical protein